MSKMIRTPIVLASAENIRSATPLEPLYDEENKDIIIKNKDGYTNTSVYKTFVDRMDKEGYMTSNGFNSLKNKKIYGFTIDFSEQDPSDAVTYTNACSDFEPISFNEDGSCNYSNWYSIIKNFFGVTPCIVSSTGTDRKVLKDVDYTKRNNENADDADIESGESGDVMVRFSKKYYKLETSDEGILSFKVANYKPDESYVCDAFISENEYGYVSEYMYVSAYEGSILDGKLRSLSNREPASFKDIKNISTNGNFVPININKYVYVQCLIWLLTKNCNTRSLFLYDKNSEKTGSMNKTDLFYKSENGYKVFGIENFLSTDSFIKGALISTDNIKYKIDGNYDDIEHYKIIAGLEPALTGYISEMASYNNGLLIPTKVDGTSNGPIGIKNINNLNEDEYVPLVLSLGNIRMGNVKSATSRLVYTKEVNE